MESSKDFFATIQNKLIYTMTGQTLAELISQRVDSSKDNLGYLKSKWLNLFGVIIDKLYTIDEY